MVQYKEKGMPNPMVALGFPVTTEQDFRHYVYQTTEFGQKIETKNGSYTYWAIGNGIELWVQTNHHKRIIGMNPHFRGYTRMHVGITERLPRHPHSLLDGAFYAWANPRSSSAASGTFPFVFDVPDYDVHDTLGIPSIHAVQIAAFALDLQAFTSDEAYQKVQGDKLVLASESFIPSGLFTAEGKPREPMQALANFSGHVIDTHMLINPVTSQKFHWAQVSTLGGMFDIVADPQVVQGTLVKNGGVRGNFWLSGRFA